MRPYLFAMVLACGCGSGAATQPETTSSHRMLDAKAEFSIAIVDAQGGSPGDGMIIGTVTDVDGQRMQEVSAVATSPSLGGEMVALTDKTGSFVHAKLPPGKYTMTYFYVRSTFAHHVDVIAGKVTRITIANWHPGPVGELL